MREEYEIQVEPGPSRGGVGWGMIAARREYWGLMLGALLYLLVSVHYLNYAPDDVFITLRYAKNLAEGQGAVYNPGENVEGFSNPAFLAILTILHPLLRSPYLMTLVAKLIGLIAGLLALEMAALLAVRDPVENSYWGLAPFLIGLSGYVAFWSASGMESGLHVLLVILAVGGLIRSQETDQPSWRALTGFLYGALALSRPEGVIFIAAAIIARLILLIRDRRWPDWGDPAFLGAAGIPIFLFLWWRRAVYGLWWPNTFYAKAGAGLSTWLDGLRYFFLNLAPSLWGNSILILVIFAVIVPLREARPRTIILTTAILAQWAFVIVGGGDWMPGCRFMVPVLPLVACLAPVAVPRIKWACNQSWFRAWTAGWRAKLLLLLFLIPAATHLYHVKQIVRLPSGWAGYNGMVVFPENYRLTAEWLKNRAQPGDWLATGEAGLIPYLTDLPNIDCFGLTDAHLARLPGKRHEKRDPEYILKRRPRFIVIGGAHLTRGQATSDFVYGRSLLEHPLFQQEYKRVLYLDSFLIYQRIDMEKR